MKSIRQLVKERILILDGAMGTMIQQKNLAPFAYRNPLTGKNDIGVNELVTLNAPDVIVDIHKAYIEAGADIIETNTFCANGFSLEEYGLSSMVREINLKACKTAEEARGDNEVFIAGDIGPTKESLSLSIKMGDPLWRKHDFASCKAMYKEQISALVDGGVDVLLIETVFDTLMAKSAVLAAMEVCEEKHVDVPIMLSVTFSDKSGRMLCGQNLESLVVSLSGFPLFSLGCNCSTGADEMAPLIKRLADESPFYVSAHPNAGFPDAEGAYCVSPFHHAEALKGVVNEGDVNILGGCCGTTPQHIRAIKNLVTGKSPHVPKESDHKLHLASLDCVTPKKGTLLVVGERTNVAGSSKFAKLAMDGSWDEALAIARKEVEDGASALDICMDAPLLDAGKAMVSFLRMIESDPAVNRVPVMIDSSDFTVIERAMEEIPGKAIINSISLKEGEEKFVRKACMVARYGHAMVVMLFDENGQADTYERKIACAKRSYDLLVTAGIPPETIIFDANVLAIATGLPEHDLYARDFIRAVSWIHENLPYASTSGGISNLSFAFRGNNAIRSAMHAVFLSLSGLDMAIVNPASNRDVSKIDGEAVRIITDAFEAKDEQSRDALIALASRYTGDKQRNDKKTNDLWWDDPPKQRLSDAVLYGDERFLKEDLAQLRNENPISLVEGPLMAGMKEVGKRFGEGNMFLPQVVRCARTMRVAVDILQPAITKTLQDGNTIERKKVAVLATVKGDVHDIGKNIVALVLSCNHFEVHDLGVMVDSETILQEAERFHADIVGLSGLITPSLQEMANTIRLFQERGKKTPIFVGGATTSPLHTALKLAPLYDGPVIQTADASAMVLAAIKATGAERGQFFSSVHASYRAMGTEKEKRKGSISMNDALRLRSQKETPTPSSFYGTETVDAFDVDSLVEKINYGELKIALRMPHKGEESDKLEAEAKALVHEPAFLDSLKKGCKAVYGIFPAKSDRFNVTIGSLCIPFLRNETTGLCLADFVAEEGDAVGFFVASSQLSRMEEKDSYRSVLEQLLYDRMVEVLAGEVQDIMVKRWGCAFPVIRPAPGYPSIPDHDVKGLVFRSLDVTKRIGVRLTNHKAMDPPSSICALVFSAPDACYFSVGETGREQERMYEKQKEYTMEKKV